MQFKPKTQLDDNIFFITVTVHKTAHITCFLEQ